VDVVAVRCLDGIRRNEIAGSLQGLAVNPYRLCDVLGFDQCVLSFV